MPVSKTNPPQVPPSSVSIGKKPMNYPPSQLPTNQQQQQPKSARAAAKAPAYNTQHQQQQQQSNRQTSPPNSNASSANKGKAGVGGNAGNNGPSSSQKGKASANKIWSTSTTEERERIKEFWLGLGEQERRNLVQIEKDTVLRKMKEQQKHSCSCAVCGRKRNAIEEELEVLYDAYYEELEQYANHQQRYINSGGASTPPTGSGPFPGSVEVDKNGAVISPVPVPTTKRSPRPKLQTRTIQQNGKKQPQQRTRPHPQHHPPGKDSEFDEDGDEDEEYEAEEYEEEEEEEEDELEDDEDEDDEEEEDDVHPRPPVANGRGAKPISRSAAGRRNPTARNTSGRDGVLNIGNSVTVTGPGNILTVADDLLKNDGQKFLEMMEQLAERRLQREEEAAADVEDESDEDLDEDRDGSEVDDDGDDGAVSEDEDDDDDDDEEEEAMTEEQKMEEGKRMFSIFAARMFEQRVLQAYREKVAQERQLQLLKELDEEDKTTRDREAKKQSQNQKKKDKKRQQKLAKEEERAARDAEKAAEEAKSKARQAAIDEENRKKREEERQKREAAKRAADEERVLREEEKRKRVQKEREQEQERDRKKREKEERLKKDREERERKSKEERARLAKEREEKAERDRIEKEKKAEKERQEKEKLKLKKEIEEKEREEREKEKLAALKAAAIAQPKTPIRLNATASSSTSSLSTSKSNPPVLPPPLQRTPNNSGGSAVNGIASGSKKVYNAKSVPPSPGFVGQPSRSQSQGSQPHPMPNLSRPPHPVSISPHLPQQPGMMYGPPPVGQVPVILPPSLSPRVNTFPPMHYPYNNSNMQHTSSTPIAPPANTQSFNAGPSSFDPAVSFNRVPIPPIGVPLSRGGSGGLPSSSNPPTPIGPKLKTPSGPQMFSSRRASLGPGGPGGPGPITRPIAPIARPGTTTADGTTSSGSGSPRGRSPSPKGVLGSSALAADDDEVVPKAAGRRLPTTTPIGAGIPMTPLQSWGPASPRTALNTWPAPGPNSFSPSSSRAVPNGPGPVGSNTNGSLHIQPPGGPIPPTGVESLWANMPASPNEAWHPQNAGAFFHGPNQYVNHHSAATSAPHAQGS